MPLVLNLVLLVVLSPVFGGVAALGRLPLVHESLALHAHKNARDLQRNFSWRFVIASASPPPLPSPVPFPTVGAWKHETGCTDSPHLHPISSGGDMYSLRLDV